MKGLRSLVPKVGASACALKQDKADMVSRSFKAFMFGKVVSAAAIEGPFATVDIAVRARAHQWGLVRKTSPQRSPRMCSLNMVVGWMAEALLQTRN